MAWGAWLGFLTAWFVALVDIVRALAGGFSGNQPMFALYGLAICLLTLTAVGAALGAWIALGRHLRARTNWVIAKPWVLTLFASAPLLAFVAWVPSSWVIENWESLEEQQQRYVVAFYGALTVGTVVLARCGVWAAKKRRPRLDFILTAVFAAVAGACYWADANVYPGLYPDLHVGLAGLFVACVAVVVALLCRLAWSRVATRATLAKRLVELAPRVVLGALAATVLVVAGAEVFRPNVFAGSRALILSKQLALGRALTDFDEDGVSGLFGGMDCAGFDANRAPGQPDLPENGADEDCSGTDLRWPPDLEARELPPAPAEGYNLLLISVDSMRADHLSAYGYGRDTSPYLTKWGRTAWRFARASSQDTKTWESMSSLFTGLYPSNLARDYTHPRMLRKKDYFFYLGHDSPVLTELLREKGYRTHAASMLGLVKQIGLDRGFKRFQLTGGAIGRARSFLTRAKQPFFLWVQLQWPHYPYTRHKGIDFGSTSVDLYDGEIAYTDAQIGSLLEQLKRRNLERKTIVVITSDHGEEFGEHGGIHHGGKPYREVTHVPLFIKVPGQDPAVIEEPVELVDVVPTLVELMGLAAPPGGFDGQSLVPTVAGKRDRNYRGAYTENYHRREGIQRRSLYTRKWRLIQDNAAGLLELYDVQADPGEQRDVASAHSDVWKQLLDELAARPLRRTGALVRQFRSTRDSVRLAEGLRTVRREALLSPLLDMLFTAGPLPSDAIPHLEALLARPGLSPELKASVERRMKTGHSLSAAPGAR